MVFIASITEPYLKSDKTVDLRQEYPQVIQARDREHAIAIIHRKYRYKDPEITSMLSKKFPDWKEGAYYKITLVFIPPEIEMIPALGAVMLTKPRNKLEFYI